MDVFESYIQQGYEAMATHPDWGQLVNDDDKETAAADTIASILHAIYGRRQVGVAEEARELLERAFRSFGGDYEDIMRT